MLVRAPSVIGVPWVLLGVSGMGQESGMPMMAWHTQGFGCMTVATVTECDPVQSFFRLLERFPQSPLGGIVTIGAGWDCHYNPPSLDRCLASLSLVHFGFIRLLKI